MARLHFVKRARKARRKHGIRRGQPYFWWKFRNCNKCFSSTRPHPSQLTRSEFLGAVLGAQEQVEGWLSVLVHAKVGENGDFTDARDDMVDSLDTACNAVQEQLDFCSERADNVAERFPNGCPSLELLRERVEQCERLLEELGATADLVEDAESVADVEAAVGGVSWEVS